MTSAASIALGPDPARIASQDAVWRARLASSLAYLGDVLAARGDPAAPALARVSDRLAAGPASPWTSCLYSRLVADVTAKERRPLGWLLAGLDEAVRMPPSAREPVALGDPAIPAAWWDHALQLFDTDAELPFRPLPPSEAAATACRAELAAAAALLERADPASLDEVRGLMRVLVLGAPGGPDPTDNFGACSTFFMRELVLVNADVRRSPLRAVDMLVHEASHVLLFGLAMEQPLTTDRGETRHVSAARPDPRPIDGIFHAGFVSTRVHLVMERMIASGRLTAAEATEAAARRDRNGEIATASLATLVEHAAVTPLGGQVLAALAGYWADARASGAAAAARA